MSTKTELDTIYEQHVAAVEHGLKSIDPVSLRTAADFIIEAIGYRHTIYTIGNGASAAIAQHWACDYTKGCSDLERGLKVRVVSLATNVPLMTAISNDISYDEVYAHQIERLAEPRDVLVAISSSGNSPNVVRAIEAAIKQRMFVVALTGFKGGHSKVLADEYTNGVCVHVPLDEYEAAEDCHQAIMHMIAKYIRKYCS